AGSGGAGAFVPYDRQRIERRLRVPPRIRDDGNGRVIDFDGAAHTGHLCDLGLIEAHELSAEDGTLPDRRIEHAGKLEIDRVNLLAVELVCRVKPLDGFAGDLPGLAIFKLDRLLIRWHQARCGSGYLAVSRRAI